MFWYIHIFIQNTTIERQIKISAFNPCKNKETKVELIYIILLWGGKRNQTIAEAEKFIFFFGYVWLQMISENQKQILSFLFKNWIYLFNLKNGNRIKFKKIYLKKSFCGYLTYCLEM